MLTQSRHIDFALHRNNAREQKVAPPEDFTQCSKLIAQQRVRAHCSALSPAQVQHHHSIALE
jgi:hypothetical protein